MSEGVDPTIKTIIAAIEQTLRRYDVAGVKAVHQMIASYLRRTGGEKAHEAQQAFRKAGRRVIAWWGGQFDAMIGIDRVCNECGLNHGDKLFVLSMAWLATASSERNAGLSSPGGFSDARARQIEHVRRLTAIVEADEPDLEAERLWQKRDLDGLLMHFTKRFLGEGEDASVLKGGV